LSGFAKHIGRDGLATGLVAADGLGGFASSFCRILVKFCLAFVGAM